MSLVLTNSICVEKDAVCVVSGLMCCIRLSVTPSLGTGIHFLKSASSFAYYFFFEPELLCNSGWARMWQSTCLSLPSDRITGMHPLPQVCKLPFKLGSFFLLRPIQKKVLVLHPLDKLCTDDTLSPLQPRQSTGQHPVMTTQRRFDLCVPLLSLTHPFKNVRLAFARPLLTMVPSESLS